jgi:predicted Zn-dependent protease
MRWKVLCVVLALFAQGCAMRQRAQVETTLAMALMSPREEERLGLQVRKQLATQVAFVTDPEVNRQIASIAARVLPRDGRPYDVVVIDEPRVVNAFSTPGGHIYLFTGLLYFVHDEAEVAAVIAHEAGHILRHHVARQLLYRFGYETLARIALGKDPSTLAGIGASVLGSGVLAAYGRSEELEADRVGVRLLSRSGYDPWGMPRFFRALLRKEDQPPGILGWLSSHPTPATRIEEVDAILKRRHLRGGEDGRAEMLQLQGRLRRVAGRRGRGPAS